MVRNDSAQFSGGTMAGRPLPLGTPAEVAAYLQVSERTVEDWAYRGVGPSFTRVEGQRRYKWEDVERYLAERTRGGRTIASGRTA
jgi:excisionase family DNA binding protein